MSDYHLSCRIKSSRIAYLRKFLFQSLSKRCRRRGIVGDFTFSPDFDDPVDMIRIFVKPVVAELILNPQQDKQTTCHTDGQTWYVDEWVPFLLLYLPKRNFKVVFKHDDLLEFLRFD